MTQREALDILKMGNNVFLTGPAGSGKTFVLNEYIKYLKDREVPIGITASTGIAATHMGGVTIHSWAGIGVRDSISSDALFEIGDKKHIQKKLIDSKVLIIDEISMLHHYRLDMVDEVLRHVKKNPAPFGGIQVILCGDFFQLPPIVRNGERDGYFAFESDSWKQANFTICYLHENFRQNTDPILKILNEIRSGVVSDDSQELLKTRFSHSAPVRKHLSNDSEDIQYIETEDGAQISSVETYEDEAVESAKKVDPYEITRLFTHNVDVDSINGRALQNLDEVEATYEMTSKGKKPLVEALKKSCLAPEILKLKKGARVMCVKNNFEEGYVNGTLGVVVSCGFGVDPVILVKGRAGEQDRRITIPPATWEIEDNGKVLAEITQYPLRLAWAITVHKSQGMSLDQVHVDLSKSFEAGMGYVALSRVRTLAGLTILGINNEALRVNGQVLEFDRRLRELSRSAESVLEYMNPEEIKEAQNIFLAKIAPIHSMGGKKGKAKAQKISTYDKTYSLIKAEKSLLEVAKERDITVETAIDHIEKLMQGGKGIANRLVPEDVKYLKKSIPWSHFEKLEQALEKVSIAQGNDEPPLLSPVKSKVGPNISWIEIRLARLLLGYVKPKND